MAGQKENRMEREQLLLKYFNELSPVEKDIALGKVAEVVYKGRITEIKRKKNSADKEDSR